jgi:hypothetical protein
MPGYIKPLSDKVTREEGVKFPNRYGNNLVADVYYAKTLDKKAKHPALIVGGPFGGVKEQVCVYGDELAQRGFVVLIFDQLGMGDSEGVRQVASPELYTETFSAAVDYLGTKVPYVDREKIGAIGICGGAAFALSATSMDTRIKAVVSVAIIDMSQLARQVPDKDLIQNMKKKLSLQRWVDAEKGTPECKVNYPEDKPTDEIPDGLQPLWQEFFAFYGLERGWHKNATHSLTTASNLVFLNAELIRYIDEISPRPVLFITGDKDLTMPITNDIFEKAAEPKEKIVVEWAQHIDFYDNTNNIIPFDKIKEFFTKNLK